MPRARAPSVWLARTRSTRPADPALPEIQLRARRQPWPCATGTSAQRRQGCRCQTAECCCLPSSRTRCASARASSCPGKTTTRPNGSASHAGSPQRCALALLPSHAAQLAAPQWLAGKRGYRADPRARTVRSGCMGWLEFVGRGPVREFGDGTAQSGRHPTGAGKNAPSPGVLDPEMSATAARRRN